MIGQIISLTKILPNVLSIDDFEETSHSLIIIYRIYFSSCNEDIIQLIREGAHDDIGTEKLRGLLKILPEVDESEMLKSFTGDVTKLGTAEKFLLQLIQLPK